MAPRYVDTSALVRCYFPDEPDHDELRTSLLEGDEPVVTSELTRVELASAVYAAGRAGRLTDPEELLDRIAVQCSDGGPVALLDLRPEAVFPVATELLARFPLRPIDALHLAVARTAAADLADGEPMVLVSRDVRQRAAAAAMGMPVE